MPFILKLLFIVSVFRRWQFDDLVCYTVDDQNALEIDDGISYQHVPADNTHWVWWFFLQLEWLCISILSAKG